MCSKNVNNTPKYMQSVGLLFTRICKRKNILLKFSFKIFFHANSWLKYNTIKNKLFFKRSFSLFKKKKSLILLECSNFK